MSHDKVGVIGALSAEVGRRYSSSVRESGSVGQKGGVRCQQSGQCPEPASGAAQGGSHHPLS